VISRLFQTTRINIVHGVPSESIHTAAAAAPQSSLIIDPLSAVENNLGDVETWPYSIIIDLSFTKPCTLSVIHVAAFMCVNNIPVEKAVDCFVACVGIDSNYVSCAVKDLYTTWDNLPSKTHLAQYFSMTFKRSMWLN